jgi:hypothetical protein
MFRPGDRIRCVNEVPGTLLVKGVYTVERFNGGFVFLCELIGGWYADRFVPIRCFMLDELS